MKKVQNPAHAGVHRLANVISWCVFYESAHGTTGFNQSSKLLRAI